VERKGTVEGHRPDGGRRTAIIAAALGIAVIAAAIAVAISNRDRRGSIRLRAGPGGTTASITAGTIPLADLLEALAALRGLQVISHPGLASSRDIRIDADIPEADVDAFLRIFERNRIRIYRETLLNGRTVMRAEAARIGGYQVRRGSIPVGELLDALEGLMGLPVKPNFDPAAAKAIENPTEIPAGDAAMIKEILEMNGIRIHEAATVSGEKYLSAERLQADAPGGR